MGHHHVAFEFAGANPEEGDAVAVLRIHVGLDLEDEAGKLVVRHRHERIRGLRLEGGNRGGAPRLGRDRIFQESVEQQLNAEIVHGGAEVNRGLLARLHRGEIERMTCAIEHRELLLHFAVSVVVQLIPHRRIVQ